MDAQFTCLKCGFQWEAAPGPTPCIICGHDYVEWTNYEKWREWADRRGEENDI